MPYAFVAPELVVDHRGVRVYRAYKNDDANDPLTFWFALYPWGIEDNACRIEFDARTLSAWPVDKDCSDIDACAVLRAAIDGEEIRGGVRNALPPYVTAVPSEGLSLMGY